MARVAGTKMAMRTFYTLNRQTIADMEYRDRGGPTP